MMFIQNGSILREPLDFPPNSRSNLEEVILRHVRGPVENFPFTVRQKPPVISHQITDVMPRDKYNYC